MQFIKFLVLLLIANGPVSSWAQSVSKKDRFLCASKVTRPYGDVVRSDSIPQRGAPPPLSAAFVVEQKKPAELSFEFLVVTEEGICPLNFMADPKVKSCVDGTEFCDLKVNVLCGRFKKTMILSKFFGPELHFQPDKIQMAEHKNTPTIDLTLNLDQDTSGRLQAVVNKAVRQKIVEGRDHGLTKRMLKTSQARAQCNTFEKSIAGKRFTSLTADEIKKGEQCRTYTLLGPAYAAGLDRAIEDISTILKRCPAYLSKDLIADANGFVQKAELNKDREDVQLQKQIPPPSAQ